MTNSVLEIITQGPRGATGPAGPTTGYKEILSNTITNQLSFVIPLDILAKRFWLVIDEKSTLESDTLMMQVCTDGSGTNFIHGDSDYQYHANLGFAGGGYPFGPPYDSAVRLDSSQGPSPDGYYEIRFPNSSSGLTPFLFSNVSYRTYVTGGLVDWTGSGYCIVQSARVTHLRFFHFYNSTVSCRYTLLGQY